MIKRLWRAMCIYQVWSHCPRAGISLLVSLIILSGCGSARPVRIGFITELSGINASLGVQGRNGAQLAVDAVNRAGGIDGRPLELVVRDNQSKPDLAAAIAQEMTENGIFLLTGHMTSWETINAKPVIESRNAILFSPTTSSSLFTGIRDNFFRLVPSNDQQGYELAEYAFHAMGLRRAAILDDNDNATFTHAMVGTFVERFTALGGEAVINLHFSSKSRPDFRPIIDELRRSGADMLLVVASSMDTALVAQNARLSGWQAPVFTSNWAYTSDLIRYGGSASEGIVFLSYFNTDCSAAAYLQFKQDFQNTFGQDPTFAAALSYETIQVAAAALKKTGGRREGLEEALIDMKQFQGLCDSISIDEYGDVQRSQYLFTVQDGKFQPLDTVSISKAP